jgi:hypothetical protein
MKMSSSILCASLLALVPSALAMDSKTAALLRQSLQAQGGEQALRAIENIQWQAVGYRNALEQSERPEGPYITEFDSISVIHDFAHHRASEKMEATNYPIERDETATVMNGGVVMYVAGTAKMAGTPQMLEVEREREALSPERLLLTALESPDAHTEPDITMQSVHQNVVVFTLDGAPVRVYLNADTHLPTAVDYCGPLARSGYWAFLGDVTQRTYYGFWWLAKGGIHLPLQWNITSNDLPSQMVMIRKLEINVPVDDSQFSIPPDVQARFNPDAPVRTYDQIPLGLPNEPAKEIAPGVIFIPGRWNVTLVKQADGVVVIEAPISSGYSAKVIEEAKRRFPGSPIKAVITTSDSWPHLAGIREYVADGIPVYALDRNRPILERIIEMPYTSRPDLQQRAPRKPIFNLISGKVSLGNGPNRIEIYPIHGETSERQMMVYFPEYRLLYGSDPFQQLPDGSFFYPQTVSELMEAVQHNHLNVQRFFMMHIGPASWGDLSQALEKAKESASPTGILM